MIRKKILILASVLLSSSGCIRSSHTSKAHDYSQERWYAAPREVPPLELKYHSALASLPQGEDLRARLCFGFDPERSQDFDKVRQAFCRTPAPQISSLYDLQAALGLAIPGNTPPGREHNGQPGLTPGWALTGHSTSLVSRLVSPLNPRVILFTAPKDFSTPIPDFVVMGFVRGDQFAEVIAREPKSGTLKFFLMSFTQACNESGGCSTGHLQSAAIESNWQSLQIYEDTYLANTVFDCTHCHQPNGPMTNKMLRLQETERPWSHFFRNDTAGRELVQIFKDFHGTDEGIGGIPAALIESSDPEKLVWFLRANGFGNQPNSFPSDVIEGEVKQEGKPGTHWTKGWQQYVKGETIPFPSWANSILDSEKLRDVKVLFDKAKAKGSLDERPDLRLALDDRLAPTYGTRAPQHASGKELLALACQRCHNQKLDPNLGKSLFRADQSALERTPFSAKNAIARLEILRKDPSNPLAMPPRLFMDLTDSEIDLLIQELKAGRDL